MLQSRVKTQSRVLYFRWYFAIMAVIMVGLASFLTYQPAQAQSTDFSQQVVTVSATSAKIRFISNVASIWVDVHYKVNNGGQQNFRMTNNAGTWEQLVSGLTNGAVITYFFTYEKNGLAYDSAWFNATFGSSTPTATPVGPTATPVAPTATPVSGWTLQWSDEFNAAANTGLNTNQWIYDIGHSYPGGAANWGTGEIAYHTNSTANVYHDGTGNLIIKTIRTNTVDTGWTGGRVETQRSDFQPSANGKMAVEGRLQLPNVTGAAAQGIWPAFWMLGAPFRPDHANWPGAGEIDILESVNGTNVEYGTFHCGVTPGGPCNETNGIGGTKSNVSPSLQAAFHTYRIEFDKSVSPQQIRWYLDGVNFHTVNANQVDATTWNNATNHGFFIILNNTVGGGWPGNPTANTASGVPFLIDYVRVYYSN